MPESNSAVVLELLQQAPANLWQQYSLKHGHLSWHSSPAMMTSGLHQRHHALQVVHEQTNAELRQLQRTIHKHLRCLFCRSEADTDLRRAVITAACLICVQHQHQCFLQTLSEYTPWKCRRPSQREKSKDRYQIVRSLC